MKLLVVTTLKEYLPAVTELLKQAQISLFSVSKTTGMKTADDTSILDDWFGAGEGEFDSLLIFSFTGEASAGKALALVEEYNRANDTGFPVRAFLLPVEQTSR
ncbi:MAG: hypothetical protein JST42_31220 [Bacteroidetes bacterium]|nr:hypothetical protein [Bacteroidota bacterium]